MDPKMVCVSIADLNLRIESEIPFELSANFLPFLKENEDSVDCYANIIKDWNQYYPTEEKVWGDLDSDVCKDEKEQVTRWYRKIANSEYYAFSSTNPSSTETEITIFMDDVIANLNQIFHMTAWEKLLCERDRLVLHASCISTEYGGILFSGVSGIGKSTQADLWVQHRNSHLINGDRTILYKAETGWKGYGSPYAGSSRVYLNENVPIKAIVLLEQAKNNSIKKVAAGIAFRKLYTNMVVYPWDRQFVEKIINLISLLVAEIPVYILACSPDEEAVKTLETVLK